MGEGESEDVFRLQLTINPCRPTCFSSVLPFTCGETASDLKAKFRREKALNFG